MGEVPSLDQAKIKELTKDDQIALEKVQGASKRGSFVRIAVLPSFMLVCYLGLFFYFKSKGGYKPVQLDHADEAEPGF